MAACACLAVSAVSAGLAVLALAEQALTEGNGFRHYLIGFGQRLAQGFRLRSRIRLCNWACNALFASKDEPVGLACAMGWLCLRWLLLRCHGV